MIGDAGQQDLGIMVVQTEDLLHQPAHVLAATLVEHQDGRSGAAQCAAEQAGRARSLRISSRPGTSGMRYG